MKPTLAWVGARFTAAGILSAALAGCASQIESTAIPGYAGYPSSILVVENLGTRISQNTRNEFKAGLAQAVGQCRITLTVHDLDPLSLDNGGDNEAIAASLIARVKPDAVMTIGASNTFLGDYHTTAKYNARLVEIATRRVIWRGSFVLESGTLTFYSSGRTVAADLVKAMAAAGTLKSCPPPTRT